MAETAKGFDYRILVVDDEESIRKLSSTVLQAAGFEVRVAIDGFDALVPSCAGHYPT